MKRKIASTGLVFLLLFGALWVYVQSDAFAMRIRPLIVAPLQELLGPKAKIGWVRASLFPLFLEARDTVVPSETSGDTILVRKVRFYLNPFPLLYKKISIPSLSVLEPRITAVRSPDGGVDVLTLVDAIRKNASHRGGGSSFSVVIGTITVRNGTILFIDQTNGSRFSLKELNLKARASFPVTDANVRLTSAKFVVSAPSSTKIEGDIKAAVSYDTGRLSLASAEIRAGKVVFGAAGRIDFNRDGAMDLKVTVRTAGKAARTIKRLFRREKERREALFDASFVVQGTLKAPVASGDIKVRDVSVGGVKLRTASAQVRYRDGLVSLGGEGWDLATPRGRVKLKKIDVLAGYRDSGADIDHALIETDDATLNISGRVDRSGYRLTASAAVTGKASSLAQATGIEMSGSASVAGTVTGPLADPEFDGTLTAGPLHVRGVQFQNVSAGLRYRERIFSVNDAVIRQDASKYILDGSVNFQGDKPLFDARLDVINSDVVGIVSLFTKRIPLELTAVGQLYFTGAADSFTGGGNLELGPGVAYGESFDRARLSVELTAKRVVFPQLVIRKNGGTVTGSGWIGFDGTYSASLESGGIDLSTIAHLASLSLKGPVTLHAASSGSFSAPVVNVRASVSDFGAGNVHVGEVNCSLDIEQGIMTVASDIRSGETASLDLRGTMKLTDQHSWNLAASLNADDLDLAELFPDNELLSKAKVTVHGDAQMHGAGLEKKPVKASLSMARLALTLDEYRSENDGPVLLRLDGGRIIVQSLNMTGSGTRFSVSGSSGLGDRLDLAVTGDANLSLARLFTRDVEHGDGVATLKITVRETWKKPDIAGELTLRNGLLKLAGVPQTFSNMNGSAVFDPSRIVSEGITGDVGGGTFAVTGSARLENMTPADFSARAVVENVVIRYPPGLTATVGGTLYYDGDRKTQTLTGEIAIRRARYEKRVDWKSMLVDFGKSFSKKKKEDLGRLGDTRINLRFYGTDDILFENNLAKIPLDIDLLLQGTVSQPQLLGRVEARKGEVYFRKNVFTILHASADFADPNRINPVLDVQAETKVRDYDIRLGVSGTADRAVVTFVSDPPLTDSDILAMLAIGRTGEELKGKEGNVGSGEALAFATGKFQDILENRARNLTGLDRFQVDPYVNKSDVSVPRVTVGKELLQDKLYVTYSQNVGATTPEQIFRIEYILNRNVSLVGERNDIGNLGADLKFRFEFK